MSVDRQQRNISIPQHEISFHRVQRLHSVSIIIKIYTRILVHFAVWTYTYIYERDFSEFGTQYSCNVFSSQSRN
jgi:hypothetical protein